MKKFDLSIVIPCYNEGDNLPILIDKICTFEEKHSHRFQYVLVDNGSTDHSYEILKSYIGQETIKIVKVDKNRGYGDGILRGLAQSDATVLAWTHADLQTDISDVLEGFKLIQETPEENIVIKGKRTKRKFLEAFFTFGMQIVCYFTLKVYLDDINAQPKIFRRSFFQNFIEGKAPKDFSLDLYLLYSAKKFGSIKDFKVEFNKRKYGEAKGGGGFFTRTKLIKRTFAYIYELKTKVNSNT